MFKLTKYLKPFIISIIAVMSLLFIQAISDLALPDYMSNIVNVGIQQGGVENAVPQVIQQSEMDKLLFFMNDDEKAKVEENYILLDKDKLSDNDLNKYVKKYPQLENYNLYKLDTDDKDIIDELNSIFGKAILTVSGIEKGGIEGLMEGNPNASQLGQTIPKDMDPFTLIQSLPKEQLAGIQEKIDEKINAIPDSMITQGSVSYIHSQYDAIGIDTDKLQSNYILLAGAKMIGIALISMAAAVVVGLISARVAAGMSRNLRGDVFKKVTKFSNAEFDKFSTASLITRSTNDIQQIQMLVVMLLRIVFYAPILGVGGILKVVKTDSSMTWIIAIAVVSILTLVSVLFGLAIPKFKKVQKLVDKLNLVTRESLTGMLVIRAFSTQKYEEKKFHNVNTDLTKTNLFVNRLMGTMMPVMMLIMNGITLLIIWVGSHQIDSGVIQVGDMMAFMQYAMQIIMSFLMISMISIMLPRASVSAQRISEVLATTGTVNDTENPKGFIESKKGYVEFSNVSFKYPGAEENVLSNISFVAKPGQTTAFIGSTGSGKSTLINLIPRFYDVTEGQVLVDGVDVREVPQHDLREKLGYIPQKGILFSGTIESNLKYGFEDATMKEMEEASEIAQAIDFINEKTEKFESEISQGGSNVSGGQKQRLSIARALIRKPEIFIFDDSFSALDFKTDSALRKALKDKIKESTVLIVAQRISTIQNADQIVVLDEGKIVGIGTHKELMKNCEVYEQIALSQLSKEELM